jgi:hypothetical protein
MRREAYAEYVPELPIEQTTTTMAHSSDACDTAQITGLIVRQSEVTPAAGAVAS